MRGFLKLTVAVLFMMIAVALSAHAQVAEKRVDDAVAPRGGSTTTMQTTGGGDSVYRLKQGDNEFSGWGGIAFAPTTAFGGLTDAEADGRKFVIAAFRYGRTLAANKHLALQYTVDAIPLAIATNNIVERTTVVTGTTSVTTFRRESAYGVGLTPLGIQLDFANSSKVKPFIHAGGGFLVFNKALPLTDAGTFALVGEGGGGLRIFTSERRAVSLGVRLHHISNGDRSGSNRGLN